MSEHSAMRRFFFKKDNFNLYDSFRPCRQIYWRSFLFKLFYSRFRPGSRSDEQSRCCEILLYIYWLKGPFILFLLTKVNILSTPQKSSVPVWLDSAQLSLLFYCRSSSKKMQHNNARSYTASCYFQLFYYLQCLDLDKMPFY